MSQVSLLRLLGRPPLTVPRVAADAFEGRTVLVTGAGGSIGSALCRALSRRGVGELVLLEHAEGALARIQKRLSRAERRVVPILGSAGDAILVRSLFERYRPEIVFHAAAFKHLPLLEGQVVAAVENNVLATRLVVEGAVGAGAKRFVLLSTDKAARPTSVLGASKRAAELVLLSHPPAATRLVSLRLGNVLGTSGSVLPRLRRQIRRRTPLTVSHEDAARYFATPGEAVGFLLAAAQTGDDGDLLVPDLGMPVRILDLARRLLAASGADLPIAFTGLLPGEKLHEDTYGTGESPRPTGAPGLSRAEGSAAPRDAGARLDDLARAVERRDGGAALANLRRLVPDYRASASALETAESTAETR